MNLPIRDMTNVQRHVAVYKFEKGESLKRSKNSGEPECSLTDTSKSGMRE